jgi:predicted ATPase
MATVSFVNIDRVLKHIGYSEDEAEQILDAGFSHVSWGDAALTLIGNNLALHGIYSGNMVLDEPFNPELITMRYWEVVGQDDYVNMETYS